MATIEACLICGGTDRDPILDLGLSPLANGFVSEDGLGQPDRRYPLAVQGCRACGLIHLTESVPPEELFSNYLYMSGTSATILEHNRALAAGHVRDLGLKSGDLVVEVASNDGSLLSAFQPHGVAVLGVEPASNLATLAVERGVPTVNRFFGEAVAEALREEFGAAALICANNVLAHVPDPVGFLTGCRKLLRPNGVVSVEVPHVLTLMQGLEYDTIYHEHLSYFSMMALSEAFTRAGLAIFRVDTLSIHGGSLRVMARPGAGHGDVVAILVRGERESGLGDPSAYAEFGAAVARSRASLVDQLEAWRSAGLLVVGYGAPAKGNTLLNYCNIGPDLLAYTVDKNPLKVGRYTPGMRLPVHPVERLRADRPAAVLVLPWNIASEVRRQESALADGGTRFFVPLPELRELS